RLYFPPAPTRRDGSRRDDRSRQASIRLESEARGTAEQIPALENLLDRVRRVQLDLSIAALIHWFALVESERGRGPEHLTALQDFFDGVRLVQLDLRIAVLIHLVRPPWVWSPRTRHSTGLGRDRTSGGPPRRFEAGP